MMMDKNIKQNVSRQLQLENLKNTRDLGGMKTADGRQIRDGRLFRSGQLHTASEKDQSLLEEQVELIVDFRTEKERREKPDPELKNTENIHLPIFDGITTGITREQEADQDALLNLSSNTETARKYMCSIYESFADNPFSLRQYEQFVRLLLNERYRSALWHCTAGKDRAGFGTIIVQNILGVEEAAIKEDYLQTNVFMQEEIDFLKAMLEKKYQKALLPETAKGVEYLFGAWEEYYDSMQKRILELFGSWDAYVRDGLRIRDEEVLRMRELYLE